MSSVDLRERFARPGTVTCSRSYDAVVKVGKGDKAEDAFMCEIRPMG